MPQAAKSLIVFHVVADSGEFKVEANQSTKVIQFPALPTALTLLDQLSAVNQQMVDVDDPQDEAAFRAAAESLFVTHGLGDWTMTNSPIHLKSCQQGDIWQPCGSVKKAGFSLRHNGDPVVMTPDSDELNYTLCLEIVLMLQIGEP